MTDKKYRNWSYIHVSYNVCEEGAGLLKTKCTVHNMDSDGMKCLKTLARIQAKVAVRRTTSWSIWLACQLKQRCFSWRASTDVHVNAGYVNKHGYLLAVWLLAVESEISSRVTHTWINISVLGNLYWLNYLHNLNLKYWMYFLQQQRWRKTKA